MNISIDFQKKRLTIEQCCTMLYYLDTVLVRLFSYISSILFIYFSNAAPIGRWIQLDAERLENNFSAHVYLSTLLLLEVRVILQ